MRAPTPRSRTVARSRSRSLRSAPSTLGTRTGTRTDSMPKAPDGTPRKGRGAVTNPAGRFERFQVVPEGDAAPVPDSDQELPRLPTVITPETTRTILARNDSPD